MEFDGTEYNPRFFKPPKPIRLKGEALAALRLACYERAGGICEQCGEFAPWDGPFWIKGDMCHIIPRAKGGDTLDNVRWKHHLKCHLGLEHGKGIK